MDGPGPGPGPEVPQGQDIFEHKWAHLCIKAPLKNIGILLQLLENAWFDETRRHGVVVRLHLS